MRKEIIMLTLLAGMCLHANASYTGRVFVDTNKNGQLDNGEKALSDVLVSDGLHVVKTKIDGTFSLPGHAKERFVFITTPSGYKTDHKHYIPIEDNRASYDFGIQKYSEWIRKDGSHRYIQITDTEIFNTENHEDWISSVRGYANNEKAAFIVHTGDICYDSGLKNHIRLMNTENMHCPVFYCIGNHDLVKGNYGEELFESLYGPVYYSFDAGNVHYIVTPMLSGDYRPSYTKADVYHWLKNDLALVPRDKPIVVFNHDILTNDDDFMYGISETEQINLNEHNLKAWVYGHWHMNYMKKQGNVYSVCTGPVDKGGIDHSTSVFRVMHVDNRGDFTSELRYSYLDKSIRIASPGNHTTTLSEQLPFIVNVYSSVSPTREVRYACYSEGKAILSNVKMHKATDWSWQAPVSLNAKYKGKEITLKATAYFNNGETAVAETSIMYGSVDLKPELTNDWVNLSGNAAHTGVSPSGITPPLSLVWTKNVGANIYMSSPLIYQGNVYVASVDENLKGEAHVYSLDGVTGKIRWKYPVRSSVKNTIAIEKGILFAQDVQGFLYAIDAVNGNLVWEKQLPVEGLPSLIEGLVASEGIVYAGAGKGFCALDATTGNIIWKNNDWSQGSGATSTLSVSNNTLVASSQWSGLYGNDLESGKLKWHLKNHGITDRGASAAIHDHLLYITSAKSLFIINPDNGNIIVRKEYPFSVDVTSTPLLTDKWIVFGTVDSGLVAVDKETLEYKWKFQTDDALVYTAPYTRKKASTIETSPVLSGNTIYFGASDGAIYGIDKDNGQLAWKHSTGAPVFGSVAISGNTLVAVDLGGNVYAFCASYTEDEPVVRFAIFSDIHNDLVPDGEKRLQTILEAANQANVDFIIELGDFCHPDEANKPFLNLWNRFKGEKYHVLGNHDMDRCSKEEYIQARGMEGRYYSFDKGDYHFIILDANNRFENGQYIPFYKGGYSTPTSDYIDEEQIQWLKNDLATTNKRCVVFSHQSLEAVVKNRELIRGIFENENKRSGYKKVVAAFSGHDHTNYSKEINGISYTQINSASYIWVDEYPSEERYTKEINQQYPYLKYTIPYEGALWGIVTLHKKGLQLRGTHTGFLPPTPQELGMPETLGSYPIVPFIKDVSISWGR